MTSWLKGPVDLGIGWTWCQTGSSTNQVLYAWNTCKALCRGYWYDSFVLIYRFVLLELLSFCCVVVLCLFYKLVHSLVLCICICICISVVFVSTYLYLYAPPSGCRWFNLHSYARFYIRGDNEKVLPKYSWIRHDTKLALYTNTGTNSRPISMSFLCGFNLG